MAVKNTIDWRRVRRVANGLAVETIGETSRYFSQRARAYCPVDTGDLRRSITVEVVQRGRWHRVVAGMPYAAYVEFGTLHGSTWVAPQPFFRNALADTAREFPALARGAMVSRYAADA